MKQTTHYSNYQLFESLFRAIIRNVIFLHELKVGD